MVTISFPGFGIDEFTIKRAIFSIKNYEYRWYTLIITCGILLALL